MRIYDERGQCPGSRRLSELLIQFVTGEISALAERHAPGLILPRVFAGHPVGPDTRSDLAYTLGLLHEAGVREVAGTQIEPAVLTILQSLDGARTDTFYSYRAAETLLRFGGYHENPRLAELSEASLANLREAFDSSASVDGVRKGQLPQNYAVVVARCEHARQRLGLLEDPAILDELLERSRALVGRAASGWIDDSNEQRGQFDIYTADIFLFAEPLADSLGKAWTDGLRRVLSDVDALALPGGAIVWGRSIGALGLAMTIELGAAALARGLTDEPGDWLARMAWSLDELRGWFSEGVIRAHQHRSTMFYRGTPRRLQMTLDVLGKLVQAALELRRAEDVCAEHAHTAWRPVDRLVRFGSPGANEAAGAWAHRDHRLAFVLPLIGGFSSDYLPSPRAPGLFEQPTSGPVSMTPVVHRKGKQLVCAGVPERVVHEDGSVAVAWKGWSEIVAGPGQPPTIEGERRAVFRVAGRSLLVEETLDFDAEPATFDALALQVPACAERPLDVEFECDVPHAVTEIDVDGLAEYRSFWSSHASVHQLDIEPARRVALRWKITPRLRVASTAHTHPYDSALYEPLQGRVEARDAPRTLPSEPRKLREIDVLHMHWPEWWLGPDVGRNREALERLAEAHVRIVWTQHNLLPHVFRNADARTLYEMWAAAADAVIHHTEWGRERALATYDYGADTLHRVIPHGHWGARFAPHALADRARIEAELGLEPCALRLGVVGAPRREKDVQLVLDAFHACSREDLQLLVVCIAGEEVPDDPRIRALPSDHVPEHVYYQRLVALDALILPFAEGMLMTGTVFDAIGAEKAALISGWAPLAEVLGDAGIAYGTTRDELTACLEALTPERVSRSAQAMRALKPETEWGAIAEQTRALLEAVAAR